MNSQEARPGAPSGDGDSVLHALQQVARSFDRPYSAVVLTAGLALTAEGRLPFQQLESAAEQAGLRARLTRRRARRLGSDAVPAILETNDGGALVLCGVKDREYRIYDPQTRSETWRSASSLARVYAGRAVLIEPDPTRDRALEGSAVEAAHDHWFWSELRKSKDSFVYVALAAVVINLLAFAMPLFTMNVYDRILPNRAAASLWVLAAGVVLALTFEFLLRLARARVIDEAGREIDHKLAQRLFEKVMNIPLEARSGATGSLARRLSEYETVRDFFTSTTLVLIIDSLFVVLFLALIAALGGWLVLVPLTGLAVMVAVGMSLQRLMTSALKDAQADSGLQHSTLVEAIAGAETLKAVGAEGRMLSRWRRYVDMSAGTQARLRRFSAIAVNTASLCQQSISVCLVVGGFYLFSANKLSMGALIAIVMIAGRSLAPVGQFALMATRARQAMLTLEALQKIMDAPDEREQGRRSVTPVIAEGAIELSHVGFSYPRAETPSLKEVSLRIKAGERIGLVGRVASGKSTLGRVISGLYAPTEGVYTIDGFDSRQHHPHQIRQAFRYVGQEAELFSGTVRENLMLGAAEVDDERLLAAVAASGADLFLGRGAAGFDAQVGERGARLSGGQRSFLALARALVEPGRLLFLDEPTGAMDNQSEQYFIEKLSRALSPQQTLIVSTHRTALLSLVDRLIVLDQGRIIADGPKAQVLTSMKPPGNAAANG